MTVVIADSSPLNYLTLIGSIEILHQLYGTITLLDELQSLGVAFVSLAEGIDATTPAGTLQMQILGAIA